MSKGSNKLETAIVSGGAKGSQENKSQISYGDKQNGSYVKATVTEKATAGDFYWKNGTTGTRSEYKQTETVRVGDKSGYTEIYNEQRVRDVTYSNNYGGNNANGGACDDDGGKFESDGEECSDDNDECEDGGACSDDGDTDGGECDDDGGECDDDGGECDDVCGAYSDDDGGAYSDDDGGAYESDGCDYDYDSDY